jgi:DnaJ-like protein
MEGMTERKPQGMSFTSWIDQQIRDAERRGLFEDLPGAGKPLDMKPSGGDYGQAWVRDYALREGVAAEEFLPTPLRLLREAERLAEVVPEMRSEQEVREAVSDINRRIVDWRKIPEGPPLFVRLVNKDEMTALWRAAHEARTARPAPLTEPGRDRATKRRPWWRLRRSRSRSEA